MPTRRRHLVRRVCVRLPDDLAAQLLEVAQQVDETPSTIIRQALAATIRVYERRLGAAAGGRGQADPPGDRGL
jgi:predicted transcriptional regulator